jgi:hypothetical protein
MTLSMFAEPARQLIRRRLVDRLAPRVYAVDVWDGVGDGRPCDGCGQAVTKRERAVEAIVSMLAVRVLPRRVLRLLEVRTARGL